MLISILCMLMPAALFIEWGLRQDEKIENSCHTSDYRLTFEEK